MGTTYDFTGWATRNDLKCSDGRTIRRNAFKDNDGQVVPMVWNHQHNDPLNVLGHALLKNKDEGVYAYCTFNDTEAGKGAKELVKHGDVTALSIYANQLKQNGGDVIHGVIREVSLVLAGANPGALIDSVLVHGEYSDDEAVIYTDSEIDLYHSDEEDDDKKKKKKEDTAEEEPKEETEVKIEDKTEENSDGDKKVVVKQETKEVKEIKSEPKEEKEMADSEKTVKDVFDTFTDEQKTVVYALIGQAIEDAKGKANDEDDEEEDSKMKHNVFEYDDVNEDALMHDGLNVVLKDAKKFGTLRESYLEHAAEYGIENIDFINTDEKNIYDRPQFIDNKPNDWVSIVVNGVHNTPFANVRMIFADITEDEARAKGYIKGKYKKDEVFKLLKRSVTPTTIYKKQRFDKNDLVDADFDVLPWIKQEMSIKFDEEKARAYLFGDGRSTADEDKVDESHIIPVVSDEDLFSIKKTVTPAQNETLEHALIKAAMLAQDEYQGSGNTTAFFESRYVTQMMLMEDQIGHRIYKTEAELAGALGVSKVVKVPRGIIPAGVYGVIVDLRDYNVGMKDAGKTGFFDDFDIDYNQQKYLMETRQSGALTKPYSAIVLKAANAAG